MHKNETKKIRHASAICALFTIFSIINNRESGEVLTEEEILIALTGNPNTLFTITITDPSGFAYTVSKEKINFKDGLAVLAAKHDEDTPLSEEHILEGKITNPYDNSIISFSNKFDWER